MQRLWKPVESVQVFMMVFILLLLLFPALRVQAAEHGKKSIDEEAQEIYDQLMCPICPGQTIGDSKSGLSAQMRELVLKQLQEGKTRDEILQFFVSRYGEWVLVEPKKKGFNLVLWILPAVIILSGSIIVYFIARRWSKRAAPQAEVKAESPELSQYNEQLEKELERFG